MWAVMPRCSMVGPNCMIWPYGIMFSSVCQGCLVKKYPLPRPVGARGDIELSIVAITIASVVPSVLIAVVIAGILAAGAAGRPDLVRDVEAHAVGEGYGRSVQHGIAVVCVVHPRVVGVDAGVDVTGMAGDGLGVHAGGEERGLFPGVSCVYAGLPGSFEVCHESGALLRGAWEFAFEFDGPHDGKPPRYLFSRLLP